MKTKQMGLILLTVLILSLFSVGRTHAKELVKVTIAGPGLNGEVELTDIDSLKIIGELGFADQIYPLPCIGTESYFEIHTAVGDDTQIVAIGIYRYYPASKQHPSYIYYPGSINAWSSRDGQCFRVPEDTDQKLHNLLAQLGAFQPATTEEAAFSSTFRSLLVLFIAGSGFCIMMGIAMKRRRVTAAR